MSHNKIFNMKCFQCLTESEQADWNVFSSYLGSSMESNQPLLDLAELETCDQVQVDNIEDHSFADLLSWLQDTSPIQR